MDRLFKQFHLTISTNQSVPTDCIFNNHLVTWAFYQISGEQILVKLFQSLPLLFYIPHSLVAMANNHKNIIQQKNLSYLLQMR